MSQNKEIKWFKRSESFNHYISPNTRINKNTYAFDLFEKKKITSGMKSVPATSWIVSNNRTSEEEEIEKIMEESIFMPNYNCVLTVLWVR